MSLRDALLLARDDEEREDRNDRAVHGHRHRHLVERDAVEQDFHILDGVNGDPRLADIADNAGMVRVIAAVGGEVERDAQALLPGGKVAAVEGIGFFGGREACILADGPWPSRIHRCAHTACERRKTGKARIACVLCRVERLDGYTLWRVPGQVLALDLFVGRFFPVFQICHIIGP